MLRTNTCLTSLDLSRNRLGGGSLEWARALAGSLRDNGTLLSLSLAHNNVGVRAAAVLATGLEVRIRVRVRVRVRVRSPNLNPNPNP